MVSQYSITMKPSFLVETSKLPPKEAQQITNKIYQLSLDPTPDAKVKKQLKYMLGGRMLHRLRSGHYRIFYTFNSQYISILALRRRDDDTYDDELDAEFLGGLSNVASPATNRSGPYSYMRKANSWTQEQPQTKPLPEPITINLLHKLHVPDMYHARLLRIKDQDALLECPGVDPDILLQIDAYMFETPIHEVAQEKDLVLAQVEDLWRYHEGELLTFLLKLSPEQEKFVHRSLSTGGPTLVKGGPGTGKSMVALYRVRAMIEKMRNEGLAEPHILFTTYTNALVSSSRQLLEQLLGSDAHYIKVQTADSIIHSTLSKLGQRKNILDGPEFLQLFQTATSEPTFEGNALQQQMQRQMLQKLGHEYLLQEISNVIEARQLHSLLQYQDAARPGRHIRLNAAQRKVIWSIYERFHSFVIASGKETWQMRRTRADQLVERSSEYQAYDAVVIDEAQDLDPSALSFLVKLCKSPNQIFVTADANQSIYGSGFNWSDVHACLNFKGRTGILRTNYRSTREIGEAAYSYLSTESLLDSERLEHLYMHNGPIPAVCTISSDEQEATLLSQFFRLACRDLRHPLGSCSLFCPSEQIGRSLAQRLSDYGIEATFMKGQDLDLKRSGVKVLTLKSSKGLEFPIVALAGFSGSSYAIQPTDVSLEERNETFAKSRRTVFVGMTRAMRALFLIIPEAVDSLLLQGFQPQYWSVKK